MSFDSLRSRGARGRFIADVFVGPAQRFVQTEASGGIVLLIATAAALVWANSAWDGSYHDLWDAHISVDFNRFVVREDVRHVVNDGLMTVFFFVAGLELKRELLHGELASPRRAALPIAAALGGMVVPAAIYVAFNAGSEGRHGWGVPIATDIAFALGLLALLGKRVPLSLKVFLLALAIVDDLGAILVIAMVYTDSLSIEALFWAAAVLMVIVVAARSGLRSVDVYVALGVLLWLATLKSGIHATLAGVTLAALTPSRPHHAPPQFESNARALVGRVADASPGTDEGHAERQEALLQLERLSRDSASPLDRLEHLLHPWVSYVVVPLFALANAGVALSGEALEHAASSKVTLGVLCGLAIGKPAGILGMVWLMSRLKVAELPEHTKLPHILGAGLLGGIGFTVSIFIAGLAFDSEELVSDAKLGIFAASLVAGGAGMALLWLLPGQPETAPGANFSPIAEAGDTSAARE